MLYIFVLILKILGIILASILGILLCMVLIVLFMPIRYSARTEKDKDIVIDGKTWWLFRIFYARVLYQKSELRIKFKIFGFVIYDNMRVIPEEKVARKAAKLLKKKTKKVAKELKRETKALAREALKDAKRTPNKQEANKKSNKEKINQATSNKEKKNETKSNKENINETKPYKTKINEGKISEGKTNEGKTNEGKINEGKTNEGKINEGKTNEEKTRNADVFNNNKKIIKSTLILKDEKIDLGEMNTEFEDDGCKIKWFKKIRNILKNNWNKIKTLFLELRKKRIHLFRNLSNTKILVKKLSTFLKEEVNKEALKLAFRSIIKILKHIFPTKIKGYVKFGTGDPCTTGQSLAIISMAYPIFKQNIRIFPDFENEILEGKIEIKGRIRSVTLLIIAIKLILNDNVKQLIKNFRKFKEEL